MTKSSDKAVFPGPYYVGHYRSAIKKILFAGHAFSALLTVWAVVMRWMGVPNISARM